MGALTGYRDDAEQVKASESAHICCPHCNKVITADKKRELNKAHVRLREGEKIDTAGNRSGELRRRVFLLSVWKVP
jgi:phage terminase large subunit GpA-like protein